MRKFKKAFGAAALKRSRLMGINQSQLARMANTTQATISRTLSGQTNPNRELVNAICRALNTTLDELVPDGEERLSQALLPKPIEMVGTVEAGTPGEPSDTVRIPAHWHMDGYEIDGETYSVYISESMYEDARRTDNLPVVGCTVLGYSMAPHYLPKDVLLVEQSPDFGLLRQNDHVVVDLSGQGHFSFKVYDERKKCYRSLAQDEHFEFFPFDDYPNMRLFGRVLGLFRTRP